MIVKRSLGFVTLALLVLSLALVGTANAKSFSMSGSWYQNRGPLVDIPINGGPVLCAGASLQEGCVGPFKPLSGGIPGGAIISVAGGKSMPAKFTIPPHAFGQALGAQTAAVAIVPTVVQLVTSFVFNGPADVTQAAAGVPAWPLGQPAMFQKLAHSKDAGQAGRGAATFAWCPGVGGTACASGLAATPTAVQGIVSYTPGPNIFGGTMGMIIAGGGFTSIIGGTLPVITNPPTSTMTSMVPLLAHLPIMGTGMNPQAPGVGYAYTNTIMLGAAPLFIGFMTSTGMGGGLLSSTGPPLTTGGTPMLPVSIAGDTNVNWGFPWTTGTVSVANTETLGTMGQSGMITAMGSDERNQAGGGRITLVAGGTSNRIVSGLDFEALEVLVLDFEDTTPTPSMGPAGLATVALLMALSAGYAIRGRFASAK